MFILFFLCIQAMHPLRVILVRGSPTDLQAFSQNIRSMTKAKVFTPSLGEVVNASMESHIYQVSICIFLKDVQMKSCGKFCFSFWDQSDFKIFMICSVGVCSMAQWDRTPKY